MDVAEELSRHRGSLVLAAYRMLGSIDEAEDVVQEAFIRAQAARPGDIDNPKAWLLKVVGRLSLELEVAKKASAMLSGSLSRSERW